MRPKQLPKHFQLVTESNNASSAKSGARMWIAPSGAWVRETGPVKDEDRPLPSPSHLKKPDDSKKK